MNHMDKILPLHISLLFLKPLLHLNTRIRMKFYGFVCPEIGLNVGNLDQLMSKIILEHSKNS